MIITRLSGVLLSAATAAVVTASGCGGGQSTPMTPTGSTSVMAGVWSGTATDSSGSGQMFWTLTQSGTSFSGSHRLVDGSAGVTGTGTVTGMVSDGTITFSLSVPAGGFDGPFTNCSATMTGQGSVSGPTLNGRYTGSNSCAGTFDAGTLTLSK